MKRFLLKVFGFGMVILSLLLVLILATEIKNLPDILPLKAPITIGTTSHQWTRQREADTTNNVDVLIVGSSLGQSIDVREFQKFNLNAFNLSSGSQSPIQTSYLFDKYLDSFNPKLVIWDVHPYTFTSTGVESTVDLVSNCQDCGGMVALLLKTNSRLAWNSYLKRMMMKPFEKKEFSVPREFKISKYIVGGFMEVYLEAPDSTLKMEKFQWEGLKIQKTIFESELKSLKNKSIPVVLIYSPRSTEFIDNFQNQQEWFDYYKSIVEQGLAEEFLNLNEILSGNSENKAYFYDMAHLTLEGTKNYNKVLIHSVSENLKSIKKTD